MALGDRRSGRRRGHVRRARCGDEPEARDEGEESAVYAATRGRVPRAADSKRQQVWRDGQLELQALPLAEVRKRAALRD